MSLSNATKGAAPIRIAFWQFIRSAKRHFKGENGIADRQFYDHSLNQSDREPSVKIQIRIANGLKCLNWPPLTLELELGIPLLSKQFHIVNFLSTRAH